ncbi:hypothetical protein RMATCC62417_09345 [Rhizopus microsporus]|nr:hypothetical protein RMATCC62417_09345 [Rhizopus microsporus]
MDREPDQEQLPVVTNEEVSDLEALNVTLVVPEDENQTDAPFQPEQSSDESLDLSTSHTKNKAIDTLVIKPETIDQEKIPSEDKMLKVQPKDEQSSALFKNNDDDKPPTPPATPASSRFSARRLFSKARLSIVSDDFSLNTHKSAFMQKLSPPKIPSPMPFRSKHTSIDSYSSELERRPSKLRTKGKMLSKKIKRTFSIHRNT